MDSSTIPGTKKLLYSLEAYSPEIGWRPTKLMDSEEDAKQFIDIDKKNSCFRMIQEYYWIEDTETIYTKNSKRLHSIFVIFDGKPKRWIT